MIAAPRACYDGVGCWGTQEDVQEIQGLSARLPFDRSQVVSLTIGVVAVIIALELGFLLL